MQTTINITEQIDLSTLSIEAQHELYDFYLFLKWKQNVPKNQERRIKRLHELKVQSFTPLTRDEIYER